MKAWLLRAWIAVGLALFAYVLTRTPLAEIERAIATIGPLALVSPMLAALWFATRATALRELLERRVPWRSLYALRWIGDGYNGVLPLAGLGGEPMKLRILDRFVAVEDGLAALVRDRLIDNGLGFIVSGTFAVLGVVTLAAAAPLRGTLLVYAMLALPTGGVLLALMITRLPGRLGAFTARTFSDHDREPAPLAHGAFWRALVWFAATRVVQTCETALLLACIDVPFDLPTILLVDATLNAAGFVGFLMPQGLGVVEGAAVLVLHGIGVPLPAATAFVLVRRGRVVVCGLVAIAVHAGSALKR
ncbi:MAG: lysylphosphatidylglycerol synthase transmembrane domain-containing protein [Kofleriaceae bacterium]